MALDPAAHPPDPLTQAADAARTSARGRPGPTPSLTPDRILDAAGSLFAESGRDAVTARAIADRLDCAVGTIYRYFPNLETLFTALTHRLFAPALTAADLSGELSAPAARQAHRLSVVRYVEQAIARPELYRLAFLLGIERDRHAPPAPVARLVELWGRLLADPPAAARRWALIHGLILLGRDATEIDSSLESADNRSRPAAAIAPAAPPMIHVIAGPGDVPRSRKRPDREPAAPPVVKEDLTLL